MGCVILHKDGAFVEWSCVLDAPATTGMGRDEMLLHLVSRGVTSEAAQAALMRAVTNGSSAADIRDPQWGMGLHQVLADNRAGEGDRPVPVDELIETLFVRREALF